MTSIGFLEGQGNDLQIEEFTLEEVYQLSSPEDSIMAEDAAELQDVLITEVITPDLLPKCATASPADGEPAVVRKLVLVDSIIDNDGANSEENNSSNKGSVEGNGSSEAGGYDRDELINILKKISEQLELPNNGGPALAKLTETTMVLANRMEWMRKEMMEMKIAYFRLTERCMAMGPQFVTPPGSSIRVNNQVIQTPKKSAEQPTRLDRSPNMGPFEESNKPLLAIKQESDFEPQLSTNGFPRRNLTFQSGQGICDQNQYGDPLGVHDANNGYGTLGINADFPVPIGQIKEEVDEDCNSYVESKFGLQLLVDAALKQHSEDNSVPGSEGWTSSDSGRSTGDSYPGGSEELHFVSQTNNIETRFRKRQAEGISDAASRGKKGTSAKQKLILPKPPSSETSSAASVKAPPKTRKRRKVKQPLPCGYCGKTFNNQSSLRQHESFHRPTRPYKCEHEKCEKAYKTRSELNRHLVVHSGDKKHFCKLCGKRFLRKQYLKTHLIRHHETGITMVTPAVSSATTGNCVMPHPVVTVASSSFVTQAEPLTWRCHLCFKIFVNNEDLCKHMRSYHEKRRSEKVKTDHQ